MTGLGATQPKWTDRLWAELKRDKKKTSLLAGLLLAAVVLVRMLVQAGGPSPEGATAAVAAPGGAMPGPTLGGASSAVLVPADGGFSAKLGADDLRPLRSHSKVSQDIFAAKLQLFPLEEIAAPAPAAASAPAPVDEEKVRKEAVLAKAKGLSLQSTITSDEPQAIISGQLAGIGTVIEGFRVVKITAQKCILAKDGVQVTLEMRGQ